MVSIPGLRGRDPKEIAVKNLSEIIGSRYKEIIDLVYHEIKISGYENKLMTGIVLTGGGAEIKNLKQLVAFITGKETRIGYPNEHLGSESKDVVVSPMYATGVGLVLKGFEYADEREVSKKVEVPEEDVVDVVDVEEVELEKEPSLLERFSAWFIEDLPERKDRS